MGPGLCWQHDEAVVALTGGQEVGKRGVGFARSKGIGTNPKGRLPLASLSNASGSGNGNSQGSGAGTRPPGGGHGTAGAAGGAR